MFTTKYTFTLKVSEVEANSKGFSILGQSPCDHLQIYINR